tara:strand:- start:3540 stop:4379 length:840 start_codon:yes stop_codon:yes gene_type:complete
MNINTLVKDIQDRLKQPKKIKEEHLSLFIDNIQDVLKIYLEQSRSDRKKSLRMSSIGKPDRRIWMEINGPERESELPPDALMRFLYGSIIEELVLFLTREAGHLVTSEQKEVTINGVKGHLDCKIDGEVVDVKSASNYGFKKFKNGFDNDDEFGYIGQLSGYVEAEGKDTGFFLAMNKATGEIALLEIENFDIINAKGRIESLRKTISNKDTKPKPCAEPIAEGKSGNKQLARICRYCQFKFDCFPDLRMFKYSDGIKYLTTVEKEPKVKELHGETKLY